MNLGTTIYEADGNFTINTGGGLIIGELAGITQSGSAGNVQVVGTRTYGTGSYYYSGADDQVTGDGLPGTVANFYVQTGSGKTLTLTGNSLVVNSNMTINSGSIFELEPAKTLTVNGTLTNNGGTSGLVLKSDATGTASLIQTTDNVDATVERYITGLAGGRNHFITPPVKSAEFFRFQLSLQYLLLQRSCNRHR
ncbi:MAG: hypothetical protein MZU79_02265 [Anaerotruncus sp.]|nr:hypothetical protein [Anaerotruncus sp.]